MTHKIRVTRTVSLPDKLKLALFARAPELGPQILFFSGGSAMNPVSRRLIEYTHNSVHLITPFDSGGSSAVLRKAFRMPAVGDMRNRMMALADQSVKGNPDIRRLFAHRLAKDAAQDELIVELDNLVFGKHSLIKAVPDPMRKIIRNHLRFFREAMPQDFDLKGASIGNLVLVGGYLNNERSMDPVLFMFSRLAMVRGMVRPVISSDLHLVAELGDGSILVGQHLMTGKQVAPLTSPIKRVYLSKKKRNPQPVQPAVRNKIKKIIAGAQLICYPLGSFYSSVIANLLPAGVPQAIAANGCPKIYIPNMGNDPEAVGRSVHEQVEILLACLRSQGGAAPDRLLNFVLVDSTNGDYPGGLDLKALAATGVEVIDTALVSPKSAPYTNPELVLGVLLSLV